MRHDPLRNFRFRLEIGGINEAHFSEVTGFDITSDAIDYREGDDPTHVRKLPGLTKYGNVTLKRGITDSMDSTTGTRTSWPARFAARRSAIIVLDEDGKDKARFEIDQGVALEVRPDGPQREGQRRLDRNAGARQRGRRRGWHERLR